MNNKVLSIIFIIFAAFLMSCSNSKENEMTLLEIEENLEENIKEDINSENDIEELSFTQNYSEKKIIIAYFTWADNTFVPDPSSIDINATTSASVLPPGDTGLIARWIQEETGGDLFSIITENKYSSNYDECLNKARTERDNNERPKLVGKVNNMNDYDIIFLGFPNWWYTCPMAVFTFLESYNFSNKTIIPFCAHGTGGLSRTIRDIKRIIPNDCKVLEAIGVYRPEVRNSRSRIINWVKGLNY